MASTGQPAGAAGGRPTSFDNLDFAAHANQYKDTVKEYQRPLAPGTLMMLEGSKALFEAFCRKLLAQPGPADQPKDYHELLASDYELPEQFWHLLAVACCLPVKKYAPHDVTKEGPLVQHPVARRTAFTHLISISLAHDMLRPHRKVQRAFITAGERYVLSKKAADDHKLKPAVNKDTKYASLQNLKDFAAAALSPEVHFRCARELQQALAYLPLLFFTTKRPGDAVLSNGYKKPEYGLQWQDFHIFYQLLDDGFIYLAMTVVWRNLKTYKDGVEGHPSSTLVSRSHLPPACNPIKLIAIMALEDEAFHGLNDASNLDETAIRREDLDATTGRFEPFEIKENKKLLPVFRTIGKPEGSQQYQATKEPANVSIMIDLLKKVRDHCCHDFQFYDVRRGGSLALIDPSVTQADAKATMGHTRSSTTRDDHYKPTTNNADIIGITTEGKQDPKAAHRIGNSAPALQPLSSEEKLALTKTPEAVHALSKQEAARAAWKAASPAEREAKETEYWSLYHKVRKFLKRQTREKQIENAEQDRRARAAQVLQRSTSSPAPTEDEEPEVQDPAVAAIEAVIATYRPGNDKVDGLAELKERVSDSFNREPVDFTPLLLHGKDMISISAAYQLLATHQHLDPARGDKCPECGFDFKRAVKDLYTKNQSHLYTCTATSVEAELEREFAQLQPQCSMAACRSKPATTSAVRLHLRDVHADHHAVCGVAKDDGTACTFTTSLPTVGPTSVGGAALGKIGAAIIKIHREVVHGSPALASDSYMCETADRVIVGYTEVQRHCAAQLPSPGEPLHAGKWDQSQCAFCIVDQTLAPSERLAARATRTTAFGHLVSHLIKPNDRYEKEHERIDCPCCGEDIPVWDIFKHLESKGFAVRKQAAAGSQSIEASDFLVLAGNQDFKKRWSLWLAWAQKAKAAAEASVAAVVAEARTLAATSEAALTEEAPAQQADPGVAPTTSRNLFLEQPDAANTSYGANESSEAADRNDEADEAAVRELFGEEDDVWATLMGDCDDVEYEDDGDVSMAAAPLDEEDEEDEQALTSAAPMLTEAAGVRAGFRGGREAGGSGTSSAAVGGSSASFSRQTKRARLV